MKRYFIFTFHVIFIALEDKVVALTSSGAFRGAKILMKDRGKLTLLKIVTGQVRVSLTHNDICIITETEQYFCIFRKTFIGLKCSYQVCKESEYDFQSLAFR